MSEVAIPAESPGILPTAYSLRCLACGADLPESGVTLGCPGAHAPALLRTVYSRRRLVPHVEELGVNRYADWLPHRRPIAHVGLPGVFHSERLGAVLGLDDLWVVFSGWAPERGATLRTGSFKELEAPVVCSRLGSDARTLVVASAGNTARAFAEVCGANDVSVLLVVPEGAERCVWSTRPFGASVRMVTVGGGADYFDAIRVADRIAAMPGFVPEGGSRNVARRDGLGTPVLTATLAMGRIPDHYVQAVGSGAGGIAAWEAAMRLVRDGRYGQGPMRLHLAQNAPFTPMTHAWRSGSRALPDDAPDESLARIARIDAHVLSNRRPPYAISGGVFDALSATDGRMYAVTNDEIREAGRLALRAEGLEIDPAAAAALAALHQAAASGEVARRDAVLLHLTGGGTRGLLAESPPRFLAPSARLSEREPSDATLRAVVADRVINGRVS